MLYGHFQQSCGQFLLYASHILPISVFLPLLYCFSGNHPELRPRIQYLWDPQQGRQMGERFLSSIDFIDPNRPATCHFLRNVMDGDTIYSKPCVKCQQISSFFSSLLWRDNIWIIYIYANTVELRSPQSRAWISCGASWDYSTELRGWWT